MKNYLAIGTLFVLTASAAADDELVDFEHLIWAKPVPAGYEMLVQDVNLGEKSLGNVKVLVVRKDGSKSYVGINVESREVPTDKHKRAAFKGYVNGTVNTFTNRYYVIVKEDFPDVDEEDFDFTKPIESKFTLKNGDNQVLYLDMLTIFTNVGHHVKVCSTSPADRKLLNDWAATIKPFRAQER